MKIKNLADKDLMRPEQQRRRHSAEDIGRGIRQIR